MFLRVAAEGSDFEGSIEREIAMGLTTRGIERPEDAALLLDHPDTAPAGLSGDEDDERDAKSLSVSSRKALSDFGVRTVSSSAALLLLIGGVSGGAAGERGRVVGAAERPWRRTWCGEGAV